MLHFLNMLNIDLFKDQKKVKYIKPLSFFPVPENLKTLLVPTPFTPRLQFYNSLLEKLHKSVYEIMNPVQFKAYFLQQKVVQWEWHQKMEKVSAMFHGSDGNAMNIQRYTSYPSGATASGVGRANRTLEFCTTKEKKVECVLNDFVKARNNYALRPKNGYKTPPLH